MKENKQQTETIKPKRRTILSGVRNKIFVGLLLATPIMATLWIFDFLLKFSTKWFPRKYFQWLDDMMGGYLAQAAVLLLIVVVLYLLGLLAHHFLGKRIYMLTDRIFSGIPLIKNVYIFIRQVCEWLAQSHNSMFQSVVLIEYPRKGIYTLGMVTSKTSSKITTALPNKSGEPTPCLNVFVATTPNPTSGFFLIVPESDVIRLDMEVADAINLIISAGAILPEKTPEKGQSSLFDIIDKLTRSGTDDEQP